MEAKELRDRIIERYKELDWKGWNLNNDSGEWTPRTLNDIFEFIG